MDPFTEKLLARTQARKAALEKKREVVAGRSPVVTPRRPLVESNTNTVPSTPTENYKRENVGSASTKGTPVVVTSTQFAGGTPKSVFFEKYSKQTSLRQKECFIELGEAKAALKNTPKKGGSVESRVTLFLNKSEEGKKISSSCEPKENLVKASSTVNTESPSVKDRKAAYMKQVKEDSATNSKPSLSSTAKQDQEHEKVMNETNPDKVFPSVSDTRASLAGGRFFNDPRSAAKEQTPKAARKLDSPVPAKPPRITAPSKANKPEQEQRGTENINDVPPKPPRQTSQTTVPPSKPRRLQVTQSSCDDQKLTNQQSVASNVKRKAPAPPSEDKSSENITAKKSSPAAMSVQKATKRCEDEIKNDIPTKKSAIERDQAVETAKGEIAGACSPSPNKNIMAPEEVSSPVPMVTESTPTQDQKEDLKRTLKSQKISAISLGDMDENTHEITFNIDMTEFDEALEDETKSKFQLTYGDRIAASDKTNIEKSSNQDKHDPKIAVPVQATFKGIHKSGYNSAYSDQYAAVVTPKKVRAPMTRNYTVYERIQILLEEAAYQQNIVLQASQAVNTCLAFHDGVSTGSSEEVEAERLLKFSTERRTACLNEVQKLKAGEEDDDVQMEEDAKDLPCKAKLILSGMKIPVDPKLLQDRNSPEPCIYNFICIIKHTPKQMYCTKAVSSAEIKNNCIKFEDKFEIKNVKPSFSLDISVLVLKTQLPSVNPTNKHKRKTMITKSVLDSPKLKQIMGSVKKSCDSASQVVAAGATNGPVFRTSDFTLVSTAHINLENVHHGKHKMSQVGEKSFWTGDVQIKIACHPEYSNQAKGFLTVFEDVGGLGDWHRYWCILDNNVLQYWKYPDDELIKPPLGSIDLEHCVSDSVTIVPRDICARPHTMQLVLEKPVTTSDKETLIAVNAGGKMLIKYMLSADTKADKTTWLNTLNESLKDWRAWHCNLVRKTGNNSESDVIML